MPYLLDTSAISELTKIRPNAAFTDWFAAQAGENLFIGAPTIGEVEAGICSLQPSAKKRSLERWLGDLLTECASQILPLDLTACRVWGRAVAVARREGKTLPVVDSQLAAIAHTNRLAIVTHNTRDFTTGAFPGLEVINPWKTKL